MKGIAGIVVVAGILLGGYYFYLKSLPVTDHGTAATQAISLTGVRTDLLQIAQAERNFVALNGNCASLDELVSGGALAMARPERDGYSYSVQCSGTNFTVVGQHAGTSTNAGVRYPKLMVDSEMQVSETE